ncbi:cysteine peptidase family C39 domain-containing protein [Flavobacterium sp. ACN6]|uniref:cysteine peptidase family C39 domain-containing protein n=1 Tax=Flavobacterium sp. ACN6 TaxID=1920426 RepID=UPI000BB32AD2|nr:cysteine peptidase family C39 domain-containing protein [Flavobacterium sp. ACN6]PBJ12296.1 Lactococcin-G-processing and transport ATP-binding protein LagD [Flavobacterium sp. ACN6]
MFNFPHEFQLDAKDCGPACIKIIAKYYGRFYSLPFLRDLCGITREGVSFLDISDACEKISLRTKSIKIDFETFKAIPLPCIVHWQNGHFIVVYKITNKQVFVFDPAKGLFPENLSLGEINNKYFNFLNALYQYLDYTIQQPYEVQKQINLQLLELQTKKFNQLKNDFQNQDIKYKTSKGLFKNDSTLYTKNVTSKADIEHSIIAKANSELDYNAIDKEISNTSYQIKEAQNKAQVIAIEKASKERELIINMFNNYYDLIDVIKKWERNYVFIAPINGKVDFLSFIKSNDFIQSGQELFKIIPMNNQIIGQVNLPENGSGKVKVGQNVIIKLNNYPFNEYGSIKGKVRRISLVTNQQTLSDNQKKVNSYLVDIDLPFGLKTNYGVELNFYAEAKGNAEIITADRRLIERFFDNLRHSVK